MNQRTEIRITLVKICSIKDCQNKNTRGCWKKERVKHLSVFAKLVFLLEPLECNVLCVKMYCALLLKVNTSKVLFMLVCYGVPGVYAATNTCTHKQLDCVKENHSPIHAGHKKYIMLD